MNRTADHWQRARARRSQSGARRGQPVAGKRQAQPLYASGGAGAKPRVAAGVEVVKPAELAPRVRPTEKAHGWLSVGFVDRLRRAGRGSLPADLLAEQIPIARGSRRQTEEAWGDETDPRPPRISRYFMDFMSLRRAISA